MTGKGSLRVMLQVAVFAVVMFVFVSPASAIPAFARKYSLRCTACHESWPVLNDFGRNFRDNGYQLRLGKDDVVTANPGYWPVAVHITPHYEYTSLTNQTTDQSNKTLKSGGIADASMALLTAGTLTKDISFLVVPTGFASDGAVSLESYWASFSRVLGTDWLNIRIGKHEVDLPASPHRGISLASSYLVYDYHPGPSDNVASAFGLSVNQRGLEVTGHDRGSTLRYSASIFSANDSLGSRHGLSSPSVYGHGQKYFQLDSDSVSQVALGVWGAYANYPTSSLTSGGVPIPGTGSDLRSSTRYGLEAQAWLFHAAAPLHLNLVYGHGSDNKDLYLGAADRNGTWNGGFLEALWVPAVELPQLGFFAKYHLLRNPTQPVRRTANTYNHQEPTTVGLP